MAVDLGFKVGSLAGHLWQRGFVALGQFLHALSKLLAHAVHLTVDGGVECGEPFVIHHQRLCLGLGELWVTSISLGVERGFSVLEALLEVSLVGVELEPVVQDGGFVLGLLVAS